MITKRSRKTGFVVFVCFVTFVVHWTIASTPHAAAPAQSSHEVTPVHPDYPVSEHDLGDDPDFPRLHFVERHYAGDPTRTSQDAIDALFG